MANEEHLAILKKGPEAWNQWRWRNRDMSAPPLDPGIPADPADCAGVEPTTCRVASPVVERCGSLQTLS